MRLLDDDIYLKQLEINKLNRELKILNPRLKTIPGTENFTYKDLTAAFPIVARYNPLLMK